jgi:5-methylcytosine-specific restriction endonuclease McrA
VIRPDGRCRSGHNALALDLARALRRALPRPPWSAEQRASWSAKQREAANRPETKARRSAISRGLWTNPAYRAKQTAAHRNSLDAPIKGECCAYCGDPEPRTIDHATPRGRTGWDAPDNTVPACRSCNARKRQRTPAEWFAALGLPVAPEFFALFNVQPPSSKLLVINGGKGHV